MPSKRVRRGAARVGAIVLLVCLSSPCAHVAVATSLPTAPAADPSPMKSAGTSFAKVDYAALPGWSEDDHVAAFKTFLLSCPRLDARMKAAITKPGRIQVAPGLVEACRVATAMPVKMSRQQARDFFEKHFEPHRVLHKAPQGLFTGYWEPFLEGSRKREGRFQTPIYKRPSDLVTVVPETDRGTVGNKLTHARQTKAGLVPFATRAEIEGGALDGKGLELIYLADPVEVFFLQIQGSGRVKLTDGTTIRVHYDGKNGHPYTSIGRYLIDTGLLAADKVSMGALGRWLRVDPDRGRQVMQQNASYVFFREIADGDGGPLGALETPLVAGRSLAVDPSVHVLGSPIYISAPSLTHVRNGKPYNRLMIAQDVGSAIKGPERGDIFFGSGERAGRVAGTTKHPGHFFALLARETPASKPSARVTSDSAPPQKAPR